MTRTEIVTIVAARLNLTSAVALARIADSVNEKYAEVLTAVGLPTSTHATITMNTTIGSRVLAWASTQKLLAVFVTAGTGIPLPEITPDELRNRTIGSDPPKAYAVTNVGATTTTIALDCVPATVYSMSADVQANLAVLGSTDVPVFPEKFHYMLVQGARAIELEKMEKEDLAAVAEAKFQERLAALRYFLAVSGYKDIHAGKTNIDTFPTQLV